ncbi:MAG: hypothetical protein PHC34_01760 [Candidatus Gastranaerophilales bacterium]|nr:hypothetical protein [Candidatus Gastranaerophilales bacterium]
MSFVTNQAFMNLNTLTRINSQYRVQQANQNLTNMLANPTQCTPIETARREKQIMFGSLQNQFMAKCTELIEQSLKKQQEKDIKRSFSTFA